MAFKSLTPAPGFLCSRLLSEIHRLSGFLSVPPHRERNLTKTSILNHLDTKRFDSTGSYKNECGEMAYNGNGAYLP